MNIDIIQDKIYPVRGQKIMLDFDLARMFEIETRALNQAVKRNPDVFPEDFMFQLTKIEWEHMSSQFVMTYPLKRPKTALPMAFTEHGVAMLANVLKSRRAKLTSIAIVRVFIALKKITLTNIELTRRLNELENKYNTQFKDIYEAINFLLQKDKQIEEQKERRRIGFRRSDE